MTAPRRAWRRHAKRALFGAAIIAALVWLAHPWWLAGVVARDLAVRSGRAVHLDSVRIGMTMALEPVIHVSGIDIANAPWADTTRPFARVREAVAVVSWRSVAERRPVISLLVLRDGDVDLQRQADGLRNWRLRNPDDRGPGLYKLLALRAERSSFRFVHRGIDLDLQMRASPSGSEPPLSATGEPLPSHLDFSGAWRHVAFKGSAAAGPELTFLETGRAFALRGHAEAGGVRLEIEGHAGDMLRVVIDAETSLAGTSLAAFKPFGAHDVEPRAFRVHGHVTAGQRRYAISKMQAQVGTTDLAGDASYAGGEDRPSFGANLTSTVTELDDLLWLAGRPARTHRGDAAGPLLSAQPMSFDGVRSIDANLDFAAKRLHAAGLPALQSMAMKVVLNDGALALTHVDLGVAGGHATGRATLDTRTHPAGADAEIDLHGVRIEAVLPASPGRESLLAGALQGRLRIKAAGDSVAALLASASGTVTAALSGGTVSSSLDARMGLEGGKVLRSVLSGDEPLPLACAALALDLQGGLAQVRSLVLDSANTRTVGSGRIDLRSGSLDLLLTPTPKRAGLFELKRSIRLDGSIRGPRISLVERAEPAPVTACAAAKP